MRTMFRCLIPKSGMMKRILDKTTLLSSTSNY